MVFNSLIVNAAFLLSLSIVFSFVSRRFREKKLTGKVLNGLLFGGVALAVMTVPLRLYPGVVFDTRSVVLSIAGLFGGPLTTAIAVVMAAAYRVWMGGAGALTGVVVILVSAGIGVAAHLWRQRRPGIMQPLYLFAFGLVVHLAMLLCMFTLPTPLALAVLRKITLPVLAIFPVVTFLLALILRERQQRIDSEQALRDSEEKYRRIVELANEGVWVMDGRSRITFANRKMAEILGYRPQEMIGRRLDSFMFPEDLEDHAAKMAQRAQGQSERYERRFRGKDGREVWTIVSATALREPDGTFAGSFGMFADITERKRAEQELAQSEETLRGIFDTVQAGIILVDQSGRITFANQRMAQMLGRQTDELIGSAYLDHLHGSESQQAEENMFQLIRGEIESVFRERLFQRKDGSTFWGHLSGKQLHHPDGSFWALVGVIYDVTERKKAENELRESHKRIKAILDAIPDPVVVYDNQGRAQFVSPAFERTFGWSLAEVQGQCIDFVPEEEREITEAKIKELYEKRGTVTLQTRRLTKGGEVLEVVVSAATIVDEQDQLTGTVVDLRDITRQKQLEVQLRQSQKLEAIGTLAGGIAHDFNNVLAAIMGYAEMSREDLPPGHPVQGSMEQILKASKRARDLVRQILSFSRLTENQRAPVKLAPIIEEGMNLLRSSLPVTIDIKLDIASRDEVVLADGTQIHQILMNLCTNAAQAMEEGGVLELSLARVDLDPGAAQMHPGLKPGPYLRLRVADTGQGIEPEQLKRIFDPFFTTKDTGKGTGMGLSVVHGIVQDHGGCITVESEVGKGSTFCVFLPVLQGAAPAEPEGSGELPRGSESILLVDDEPSLVEVGQRLLERLGYRVTAATSSPEALEIFKRSPHRFDLVITDFTMPKLTGAKLAEELLRIRPGLPIIISTGFSDRINPELAREMGIKSFVYKPLSAKEMARVIRQALAREA